MQTKQNTLPMSEARRTTSLPTMTDVIAENLSKRELAVRALGVGVTYDTALPQPLLDSLAERSDLTYHTLLSTLVMAYPESYTFGILCPLTEDTRAELDRLGVDYFIAGDADGTYDQKEIRALTHAWRDIPTDDLLEKGYFAICRLSDSPFSHHVRKLRVVLSMLAQRAEDHD